MKAPYPPGGYVLITGSSTGIGRACAVHLAARGFRVLATTRGPSDPVDGRSLQLDVTDPDSIRRAAEEVASIVGEDGLRGLVNNAGICVAGPVETLPLDGWREQFEVNLFGHIAVVKQLLPFLRRSRGRIVNISSVGGVAALPIFGAYAGTKFALEAASDALRREVRKVASLLPAAAVLA